MRKRSSLFAATPWISPSSAASRGRMVLPSTRYGNAACRPSSRTVLVTPPAPGRRPSVTSGRPSWIDGSSSTMRQCALSAIYQPPPRAVPSSAATTGMPSVSSARICFLAAWIQRNTCGPSFGPYCRTSFSSAPAKKVFLADASITPLMEAFSRARRPTASVNAVCHSPVMVLTGAPGASKVMVTRFSASFSNRTGETAISEALHDGRDAHAAAHAQRRQAVAQLAALEFVDQRAEDHRAGGAERMAHRDRAAVDVDDLVGQVHFLHEFHRHHGEGLVDFEQVDLLDPHLRLGERLPRRGHRTGQHDGRIGARQRDRHDARARREAHLPALFFRADEHRRGPVHDARGIAGGMHVLDALDLRIALDRHRVVAHLAHFVEGSLERGQAFHRGLRPDELVIVEDHVADGILDRHYRALEAAR